MTELTSLCQRESKTHTGTRDINILVIFGGGGVEIGHWPAYYPLDLVGFSFSTHLSQQQGEIIKANSTI